MGLSGLAESGSGRVPDFIPAPNQRAVDVYEIENRAIDPDGLVLHAMRRLAPWEGRTLVDLGCGSGYWLPGYATEAARVIGVEPDELLLERARARDRGAVVLPGSAEHVPLPDASIDVVHARFAYFFPPGRDAGLREVLRVLRPGGALVVIDNDHRNGEFAELLRPSLWAAPQGTPDATDEWWRERDAERVEVMSEWRSTCGRSSNRC
ncbi:MAG: class I SAM-dependent methyltransferase [Nocardiopsaceae bacterium]|nr:class I SAM-dependent methyltransferase [Nocardiopsaceae bacterium]